MDRREALKIAGAAVENNKISGITYNSGRRILKMTWSKEYLRPYRNFDVKAALIEEIAKELMFNLPNI